MGVDGEVCKGNINRAAHEDLMQCSILAFAILAFLWVIDNIHCILRVEITFISLARTHVEIY